MEPEAQAVYEKIKNELANNELAAASARLEEEHPADAADILMALNESQRLALVDRLEPERLAAVFNYLDSQDAADMVIILNPLPQHPPLMRAIPMWRRTSLAS